MKRKILALTFLLACAFLSHPTPSYADKSYGLPTLSEMPRRPDVYHDQGNFVDYDPWRMIVAPNTFDYDVYFQTGCWKKTFPMLIGRYWQLSDICEFWPKPHFKANTAAAVSSKSWILSFKYTDEDIRVLGGLSFPEDSLKIVFSDDHGESWTMLRGAAIDTDNNTIAVITDKQGGFMLMGGFVSPETYYNYADVKGAYTVRGEKEVSDEQDSQSLRTFLEGMALALSRLF